VQKALRYIHRRIHSCDATDVDGWQFLSVLFKTGERLIVDDCGSYCCRGGLQALSAGYVSSMMLFADVLAFCFSCNRTPMPISLMKEKMPNIYTELHDTVKMLEDHMRDMQVGSRTAHTGSVSVVVVAATTCDISLSTKTNFSQII